MARTSDERCAQKVAYKTAYAAEEGMKKLIASMQEKGKRVPPTLGIYRCNACHNLHLGNNLERVSRTSGTWK
jgi:hypothetical protein